MKRVKLLLIVEDDPVSAYLTQMTLEETGIAEQIVLCENGQRALEYLHRSISAPSQEVSFPQLILLDLNMPVMNGYEFLEEFMKIEELKEKNIHVVILSSASLEKERNRIENLPASGYIEKPLNETKLTTILSSIAI